MEMRVPVSGYEGYYEVSNLGNVRSLDRKFKKREKFRGGKMGWKNHHHKGRIISQQKQNGYKRVPFTVGGKTITVGVHRVVYLSFNNMSLEFKGQKSKTLICHKNDIRDDNRLENLFLGSQQDNIDDMMSKGRNHKFSDSEIRNRVMSSSKIDYNIAQQIKEDYRKTNSIYRTADKFGISYATVSRIKNNLIWKDELWKEN